MPYSLLLISSPHTLTALYKHEQRPYHYTLFHAFITQIMMILYFEEKLWYIVCDRISFN